MHDVSSCAPRPPLVLFVGLVAVVLVAGGCSPTAPEAASSGSVTEIKATTRPSLKERRARQLEKVQALPGSK